MIKENCTIIQQIKRLLCSSNLKETFRLSPKDFTRNRKMPFDKVLLFMISMVKKSLQLELCVFLQTLNLKTVSYVTNSVYNQARMKIKPEVFQYLMQVFNAEFYSDNDQRVTLWNNFRLLACDGSFLNLPFSKNLINDYGMAKANQQDTEVFNVRCSILYDLENQMILDGALASYEVGEREMLIKQLKTLDNSCFKNLIILDRGYPSFELAYELLKRKTDFVIRLQSNFSNATINFIDSEDKELPIAMKSGKNTADASVLARTQYYTPWFVSPRYQFITILSCPHEPRRE